MKRIHWGPGRWVVGGLGIAIGLYGAFLLMQRTEDLVAIGTWLAGGVLLHDGILAPLVIVACLLGAYLLPGRLQRTAVMTLVIFGSATLIAIPVLGRFGAKADNPTLLDRNYWIGWLLLGALTLAGSLLVNSARARKVRIDGTRSGR